MRVYSLVGGYDHEGESLLGVFGSMEDLMAFVEQGRSECQRRPETLGYDSLGFVESELGQPIDFHAMVEWVE
jgi:hypothetical protein